jgi:hypothetical protein
MNLFRFCFPLFFICASVLCQIPDSENYLKKMDAERERYAQQRDSEIEALRKSYDEAFKKMLESEWEITQVRSNSAPIRKIKEDQVPEKPKKPEGITEDRSQEWNAPNSPKNNSTLSFYGNYLRKPEPTNPWPSIEAKADASTIERWYKTTSSGPYREILQLLKQEQANKNLDDWSYYLYLQKIADLYLTQNNDREIWIWFYMLESGYDIMLTYTGNGNLYHAYRFSEELYGSKYLEKKGNKKYYLPNYAKGAAYYTYQGQHAIGEKVISAANIGKNKGSEIRKNRAFDFNVGGRNYSFTLQYSPDRVSLYNTLPQMKASFYFGNHAGEIWTKENKQTISSFLSAIPEPINKVRFLHAAIVQSIPYKTDEEQFGIEKWCLSEEVLFYPFADCEDRTFLLNRLIADFLGYRTIGLHFKGNTAHIAMAVEIPGIEGLQGYIHGGRKYVYVDPTFIGADIGIIPETYKTLKPEIFQ